MHERGGLTAQNHNAFADTGVSKKQKNVTGQTVADFAYEHGTYILENYWVEPIDYRLNIQHEVLQH